MIKLPSDSLKLALAGLLKVISNKSTLPILGAVRLARHNDVTSSTATNLDQVLIATLPREWPSPTTPLAVKLAEARWLRENEAMVVSYWALKEVLRAADKGTSIAVENRDGIPAVLYTFDGQECAALGKDIFKLDEFPPVFEHEGIAEPFALFGVNERRAVVEALGMSSQDETRYILNGFLLSGAGTAIVSTDGRRMFYAPLPAMSFNEELVVPYMDILRHPTFLSQDWTLSYAVPEERRRKPTDIEIENHKKDYDAACAKAERLQEPKPKWKALKFVMEPKGDWLRIVSHLDEAHITWTLKTKLIEGNFPNYKQVIPTEYTGLVTLSETSRLKFIELLERLPKTDKKSVTLDFAPLGIGIEHGPIKFWMDQCRLTGLDNVVMILDRHFLLDALKTGTREIRLVDETAPVVFVAPGGKFVVQMPMRKEQVPAPAPAPAPEAEAEAA